MVPERIELSKGSSHASISTGMLPPYLIHILYYLVAVAVQNAGYIA